jgi:4-amino-4-deoxy-L-arabinose transferase-like glycosyltransferase
MNSPKARNTTWEDKSVTILGILLAVFFLAKIVHVYTPLFHDELGVYGRALFFMLENGPRLLPGDVDHFISRGHPLFFTFFVSLVTTLFNGDYVVARCVILFLSLSLLLTTYFLGKEIGGKRVGLLATIVLAFQPIFFAQSTLILPEVMLSLLAMLCLLFYSRNQYWFFFVFASLLVLTKETSVVIFAGIALNEWYKDKFKITFGLILRVAKWAIPTGFYLLFLVIQKYQCGWYLYPYHTGLVSFSIPSMVLRFLLNMLTLFLDQGRFVLTFAAIIAWRRMSKEEKVVLFNQNFLSLAVILVMLLFSCINYIMARYFLLILPLVLITFLSILDTRGYTFKHLIIYFLMTLPFQFSFLFFRNDEDMGYLIVVENMRKSIAELDKITEGKEVIIFAQFPEINALDFLHNGYTTNPNYKVTTVYSDSVDYIIKSGQESALVDQYINGVDYNLDQSIDSIVYDAMTSSTAKVKLLYDSKLFYNRQRIFKTNN